eukprot:7385520-Prymnesium_polylepis.1
MVRAHGPTDTSDEGAVAGEVCRCAARARAPPLRLRLRPPRWRAYRDHREEAQRLKNKPALARALCGGGAQRLEDPRYALARAEERAKTKAKLKRSRRECHRRRDRRYDT